LPKDYTIGDAIDAKVGSTDMVRFFLGLSGDLDSKSSATGFRKLYGKPYVYGKPLIWSESLWSGQALRDVPDRLDGHFTLMPLYLR
jgi:hypothetical protein